jgi:phage terminase small subunit
MRYSTKTDKQKKNEGTFKSGEADKSPESLNVIDQKPPAYLSPEAKKWWARNISGLTLTGHVKDCDLTAFAVASEAFGDWVGIVQLMNKIRMIPDTEPEDILKLQRQKNSQTKVLMDALRPLGLTSVDRSKVKVDDPEEYDPFSELMK